LHTKKKQYFLHNSGEIKEVRKGCQSWRFSYADDEENV
jgi:hypothetical protein